MKTKRSQPNGQGEVSLKKATQRTYKVKGQWVTTIVYVVLEGNRKGKFLCMTDAWLTPDAFYTSVTAALRGEYHAIEDVMTLALNPAA